MKKTVLFMALFSVTLSWAQQHVALIDQNTTKLITELESKGITNYFAADRSCDGVTKTYKLADGTECTPEKTNIVRYFFWKKNGATMMKQLDACGTFKEVKLKDASLFDFYVANRSDFLEHKVRPYQIGGKEKRSVLSAGKDNCRRYFMFKNGEGAFTKHHNIFYLTDAVDKHNINYEYNNGLSIIELDKMIDEAIATMETYYAYKRL